MFLSWVLKVKSQLLIPLYGGKSMSSETTAVAVQYRLQDPAGDQGMPEPSPEPGLPFRVHGLHPLQGQGGWTDPEPGGLCGAGCHDGGVQGDTQHHGRGQREFQVLDGDAQRPEEPWCAGRAVLLRGRPARFQGGNQCRVPPGPDPALPP